MKNSGELLPGVERTGGAEWIAASYDAHKAVLLTKAPGHTVKVLDFDTASVTKSCDVPAAPAGMGEFPFEEWLADMPGKGLVYVEEYGTADVRKLEQGRLDPGDQVDRGMLVDSSVSCDESFVPVVPVDIKFLVSDGRPGLGSSVEKPVGIGKDGVPGVGWFGGQQTYLDYRVPDTVMSNIAQPFASLVLNNRQVFGAFVSDRANNMWSLSVLRKSDNTWHTVPGIGTGGPLVSGFGSFIAMVETEPKTAEHPESAGESEWPKASSVAGIKILRYVLPGKLDLYDVAAEEMYHIATNQGDSEILLVDNGTVYYRVSDRLYSAAIGTDGLEPAKLLSTSESIRDVHWAFVKH